MAVLSAINRCTTCKHIWKDWAGAHGRSYKTGCPKCRSRYWLWFDYGKPNKWRTIK